MKTTSDFVVELRRAGFEEAAEIMVLLYLWLEQSQGEPAIQRGVDQVLARRLA